MLALYGGERGGSALPDETGRPDGGEARVVRSDRRLRVQRQVSDVGWVKTPAVASRRGRLGQDAPAMVSEPQNGNLTKH